MIIDLGDIGPHMLLTRVNLFLAICSWCKEPYISCTQVHPIVYALSFINPKLSNILGLDCSPYSFHGNNMLYFMNVHCDIHASVHCGNMHQNVTPFLKLGCTTIMIINVVNSCTILMMCNSVYFLIIFENVDIFFNNENNEFIF